MILIRPLCYIDIEATGLNREADRIVELSIMKVLPDGKREIKTRRMNPTIPITPGATEVHGIKDEDVANEPTFKAMSGGILNFINGCDIAGFGSNYYDVPMLYNEFLRCGITWDYASVNLVDVGNLFKIQEPRDLTAAVAFYTEGVHVGAHGAEADAKATERVLFGMLYKYENLPNTIEELAVFSNYGKKMLDLSGKFVYNETGDIILNFGPKRGEKAIDNIDFLMWMRSKDFAPDTDAICEKIISESYNYI